MIVLIHGPDAATARAKLASVLATHDPDRATTTVLDGRSVSLGQVVAAIGSAGFFSERRVVVVHDLMARAAKPAKGGPGADDGADDDTSGSAAFDLAPVFAAVPAENVLVLVDAGLGAVPASVKRVAPVDAMVISGEPPRGQQLVTWLVNRARASGATLDPATARLIAERVYPQTWATRPANPRYDRPPDLDLLGNEVDKLATAAHPGPISRGLVTTLVAAGDDDRVFRFVEAAAAGHVSAALVELRRLVDAGEEPYKLAAQLSQQLELTVVLEAAGPHPDPTAVGKALGLANPQRMTGIANSGLARRPGTPARAIAFATAIDRQTKGGELRQPVDGLYHLIGAIATAGSRTGDGGGT